MEKMKICGIISQKKFPKGHPHYFHFPLTEGFQKWPPVF